jgi:hypothetical protein
MHSLSSSLKALITLIAGGLMLVSFAACRPSVPRPDQASNPAAGTSVPSGHEESGDVSLPPEMGGVLFVNQTVFPI